MRGLDRRYDAVVDFVVRGVRPQRQQDVAFAVLVDTVGMRHSAAGVQVFYTDEPDEFVCQFIRFSAKPDQAAVDREHRLKVCNQFDAKRDTPTTRLPGRYGFRKRCVVGVPEREKVSTYGQTARFDRFSELLPARGPFVVQRFGAGKPRSSGTVNRKPRRKHRYIHVVSGGRGCNPGTRRLTDKSLSESL